jgi:hypothetical protein
MKIEGLRCWEVDSARRANGMALEGERKVTETRTVNLYHVALPTRRRLRLLNRILKIGYESIDEWYRQPLNVRDTIISYLQQ